MNLNHYNKFQVCFLTFVFAVRILCGSGGARTHTSRLRWPNSFQDYPLKPIWVRFQMNLAEVTRIELAHQTNDFTGFKAANLSQWALPFCTLVGTRTLNYAYALSGWNRLVTPMSRCIFYSFCRYTRIRTQIKAFGVPYANRCTIYL